MSCKVFFNRRQDRLSKKIFLQKKRLLININKKSAKLDSSSDFLTCVVCENVHYF